MLTTTYSLYALLEQLQDWQRRFILVVKWPHGRPRQPDNPALLCVFEVSGLGFSKTPSLAGIESDVASEYHLGRNDQHLQAKKGTHQKKDNTSCRAYSS